MTRAWHGGASFEVEKREAGNTGHGDEGPGGYGEAGKVNVAACGKNMWQYGASRIIVIDDEKRKIIRFLPPAAVNVGRAAGDVTGDEASRHTIIMEA